MIEYCRALRYISLVEDTSCFLLILVTRVTVTTPTLAGKSIVSTRYSKINFLSTVFRIDVHLDSIDFPIYFKFTHVQINIVMDHLLHFSPVVCIITRPLSVGKQSDFYLSTITSNGCFTYMYLDGSTAKKQS